MVRCKLCDRWRARQWEKSDRWERAHSNESDLWWEEPVCNRELIQKAHDILRTDPATAFRLNLEAAEAGSAWAMDAAAWHYETGAGVAADPDKAQEYYRRAIGAGSWMATIHYARLLADRGCHDECERVLEEGVAADFVPACFWLAWLRYKRCRNRTALREARPMLEYAAGKGHPIARIFLGQTMLRGKFGLREIPKGLVLALRWAAEGDEDQTGRQVPVRAFVRE